MPPLTAAATNAVTRDDATQQFLDNALGDAVDIGEVVDEEELLAALEQEIDLKNRPDAGGGCS